MKDFFILVKALLAANVKVTPAKKQKNKKSPNYLRSLVITMIFSFFSANAYVIGVSVSRYILISDMEVSTAIQQEILSNYFLTSISIFIIAYILMVTIQAYTSFFPDKNEFILFLPIEGRKLFFARYLIASILSLGLIGPSLIAHIICYLIFSGAGVISFIVGILFALLFMAIAPSIGFIILTSAIKGFKLFSKKRNKVLFFTLLITIAISLYGGYYLICYFPLSTYNDYQILFSITKYLFWIGYIPKLFIDLDSYFYLFIFAAFIALCVGAFFFSLKISDKYYFLLLSTNEKSESKNKKKEREKISDDLIKEKLSISDNTLKSYLKRERGNIKAYLGHYISQILGANFTLVIITLLAIFIPKLITSENIVEPTPFNTNIIKLIICVALSFTSSSNSLIFYGVSIEKKNFYMIKTFPIDKKNYYLSKLITCTIFTYPTILVASLLISIFNNYAVYEAIGLILYTSSIFIISQFVYSIFGFINPNFNLNLSAVKTQTVAARNSVKYSFYTFGISLLGDEPVNLLIVSGIIFSIFSLPNFILFYALTGVNLLIAFFMAKLTMKSLDFAFSKEFNI